MNPSCWNILLVLPSLVTGVTFNMVYDSPLLDNLSRLETIRAIGFASTRVPSYYLTNAEALLRSESEDEIVALAELFDG